MEQGVKRLGDGSHRSVRPAQMNQDDKDGIG